MTTKRCNQCGVEKPANWDRLPGRPRFEQALLSGVLAALVLIAARDGARAADSVWDHNGSRVALRADSENRSIVYIDPRPGLEPAVRKGTLLFQGRRIGDAIQGTAFTFRAGCAPTPYPVKGQVVSETRIVLRGAAPVWDDRSCDVVGMTWNSPHSSLSFRYLYRFADEEDHRAEAELQDTERKTAAEKREVELRARQEVSESKRWPPSTSPCRFSRRAELHDPTKRLLRYSG